MTIEWIKPDDIPNLPPRARRYGTIMKALRDNPGQWAKISDGMFAASVSSLKKSNPDITFKKVVKEKTDKGLYRYDVFACYQPEDNNA